MPVRDLFPNEYPHGLATFNPSIAHISVSGDVSNTKNAKVVAIVGAREATEPAAQFAFDLARACVRAGGIVASGGATGIDSAAHRGALAASGRTWAVLGVGAGGPPPDEPERLKLFAQIEDTPSSSLIWPFEPGCSQRGNYPRRNGYLVAMSDVVVVIQAGLQSGSLNTATRARKVGKELWFAGVSPWAPEANAEAFAGSREQIALGGIQLLTSTEDFLEGVFGGRAKSAPTSSKPQVARSDEENALLAAATNRPQHIDELCEVAGLSPALAATAILTLALEHVLVEGPPGYYRRGSPG